jgi:hypothetical protein
MALIECLITAEQGYQSWKYYESSSQTRSEKGIPIWYSHPTTRRRHANSTVLKH